ncbi:MAG TPA: glycosyltransferase [Chthoniobacterales bacterium]
MRIVITARQYLPALGGTIQYVSMLASEFSRLGHQVKLATRTREADARDADLPFTVFRCPSWETMITVADWADAVLQVEPSLQDVWPFLLKGKPWFPTLHIGYTLKGLTKKDAVLRFLQRASLQFGHPIGVSRYVLDSWGGPGSSILNPYDPTVFRSQPETGGRDVDVLFVGRINEDKGVLVLIEVLRRLADEGLVQNARYIGAGPALAELDARVKQSGLSEVVTLAGKAEPRQVAKWMQRARVLAFPTLPVWLEASPLTLLEALACGCEVVASDIGGVAETGGGFIRLVKAGDADALHEGLRKALRGDSMRTAGVSEYLKKQTLAEVAGRYLELMQSAVKRQSRSCIG